MLTISTAEWLRTYFILISGYWCMIRRYQKLIGCQSQLKTHNKKDWLCVMQSLIKSLNFIHSLRFASSPVLLNWENLVTFHGDECQAVGNIFICCRQSQLSINDVICCQGHLSSDNTLKPKSASEKSLATHSYSSYRKTRFCHASHKNGQFSSYIVCVTVHWTDFCARPDAARKESTVLRSWVKTQLSSLKACRSRDPVVKCSVL